GTGCRRSPRRHPDRQSGGCHQTAAATTATAHSVGVLRGSCYARCMNGRAIRIIGIDPGLRRTGWGILESDGVRLVYVASGVITPPKDDDLAYRLSALFDAVTTVIQSFSP